VGAFNSAHIFGTLVPVEEPSTASISDSCIAANFLLFDHLVGEGERHGGTSRPSAFAVLRLITSSYFVGPDTYRIDNCFRYRFGTS
jgi:hypothetical protein